MKYFKLTIISLVFLLTPATVKGATEFISIVDTGPSGDYSTLSAWEQFNQTNLTSAATQVFSGTRTNDIADSGITVYLCRGGVYQTHSGTVVHATTSQILIETITGAATEQANDIWYTNNSCDSANYFTISDGGDSAISVASCEASDGTADQAAVTIDGWDTSAANYIKIYTTAANRHDGKWDEGKYRLEMGSTAASALRIYENYIRIEGLQVSVGRQYLYCIYAYNQDAAAEIWISDSIVKYTGTETEAVYGIRFNDADITAKVWNNIIYDFSNIGAYGINLSGDTLYAYNNTIQNSYYGYYCGPAGTFIAKNNIAQDCTDGYYGTFDVSSDYNISDVSQADANDVNNTFDGYKTVTFVNSGGSSPDFHLDSTDTSAKDAGTDLTAEGFTDDIDSETRSNHSWDIGADEAAEKIYRSVGPSASSYLERGIDGAGNDLNISGSTATFASDLGTDVGVGDVIQYDDDNDGDIDANDSVAFIHARASATSFTVKNSTGGAPTATLAADQDWSIFRSYDSLSHAESGDENDSVNSALRDFDTWSNGKDIVTSNEQWNIVCYNGEGDAADETTVTINDWTTGANNYIKVYTPTETTEVGETQRHSGVWDEGKYRLEGSQYLQFILVSEDYTKIEGIQVNNTRADISGENAQGIEINANNCDVAYCVIKKTNTVVESSSYGIGVSIQDGPKIYNNIVYGYHRNIYLCLGGANQEGIVYQNTCISNGENSGQLNFQLHDGYNNGCTLRLKNNIAQGGDSANVTDYTWLGNGFATTDYVDNLSEDTTSPNDEHDSKAVDFVSETGNDFHLDSTDTSAKDAGTDLSSDANLSFSDDIDGDSRPSPYWDIGADEYPASRKVRFEGDFKMEGDFQVE